MINHHHTKEFEANNHNIMILLGFSTIKERCYYYSCIIIMFNVIIKYVTSSLSIWNWLFLMFHQFYLTFNKVKLRACTYFLLLLMNYDAQTIFFLLMITTEWFKELKIRLVVRKISKNSNPWGRWMGLGGLSVVWMGPPISRLSSPYLTFSFHISFDAAKNVYI